MAIETKENKMKALVKEGTLVAITSLPIVLLLTLWSKIPATIPLHYGMNGTADGFGSREVLLPAVPITMIVLYAVLALVPFIDPKKKLTFSHPGFYAIRFIVIAFIAGLATSYIFTLTGDWNFSKSLPLLLMAFIALLGNYLPTIRPNYFVGIRTPWTLNNPDVWARTHRVSGKLWVAGGVCGFIGYLVWPGLPFIVSIVILSVLAVVSLLYSFVTYVTGARNLPGMPTPTGKDPKGPK